MASVQSASATSPYPYGTQMEADVCSALRLRPPAMLQPQSGPLNAAQAIRKQRNKPTLSCNSCVQRKLKCDRRRPSCLSCRRRRETCCYSTNNKPPPPANGHAAPTIRVLRAAPPTTSSFSGTADVPDFPPAKTASNSTTNAPLDPFEDCWLRDSGVADVDSMLPSRKEADALVAAFFRHLDPIYPVVAQATFATDYEDYWCLAPVGRNSIDRSKLALQIAVLACGSLYADVNAGGPAFSAVDRLLSACHRTLVSSSHLSHCKLSTVQTLILVCHALIATDRISHAWTFSGILQRHAYALQLHRPPDVAAPESSSAEQQLRCRLWQALLMQETILSRELRLPPPTLYHDIEPSCLVSSATPDTDSEGGRWHSQGDLQTKVISDLIPHKELPYLRLMWRYAVLEQSLVSVTTSFNQPLFATKAAKLKAISSFQSLYTSASPPFNSTDLLRFENLDDRPKRQLLVFNISFFSTMASLLLEGNEPSGVEVDQNGALIAAYEGLSAYFTYTCLLPEGLHIWDAVQRTAFTQAHIIGTILARTSKTGKGKDPTWDTKLRVAREAFEKYLSMLPSAGQGSRPPSPMHKRMPELYDLHNRISVG